jgi:hypothetical protein
LTAETRRSPYTFEIIVGQESAVVVVLEPVMKDGSSECSSSAWSLWKTALILVSPDTVVPWHHAGFRLYWRFLSRVRNPVARRRVNKEIQNLPGAGWPLFAITVTLSLLWISSQSNGHPQAALLLL